MQFDLESFHLDPFCFVLWLDAAERFDVLSGEYLVVAIQKIGLVEAQHVDDAGGSQRIGSSTQTRNQKKSSQTHCSSPSRLSRQHSKYKHAVHVRRESIQVDDTRMKQALRCIGIGIVAALVMIGLSDVLDELGFEAAAMYENWPNTFL
jgi:hypothetical protein